jgi:CubicO group peptidase (beta-lactamase class C family)
MNMKRAFILQIAIVLCAFASCRSNAQTRVASTEQERFRLAAEYSRDQRGLSILVMKGDKIIFEDYQNGHSAETPWMLASGTKSFSGVMLAAAIEDGLVNGFDEKVSDTITEWKADPKKQNITIRQLLSLTSGISAGQIGRVPSYADAILSPMSHRPGEQFEYGPVPFQVFGELMSRKLALKKDDVMSYLKRRILDPIGLKVADWKTENGQPLLPQGASLTAREWVKFGLFLKNGGKWNGKQIVKKSLLNALVIGSKANPAYGITFWLNHDGTDPRGRKIGRGNVVNEISESGIAAGVPDLYMAAGAANQRLYVIPSLDLVIVRQGRLAKWDDHEFLARLLSGVGSPAL